MLRPERYVKPELDWSSFDLRWFNKKFTWQEDKLFGVWDRLQPVEETLSKRQGDCEDYAFVAASYLLSETDEPVSLAYLMRGVEAHIVCFTDDAVYSSGKTFEWTLGQYCLQKNYKTVYTNELRA